MTKEEYNQYEQNYWEDWYKEKEYEAYVLDDLRMSDLKEGIKENRNHDQGILLRKR